MDSGSGTTRHAQGKREIIHFRDDTEIRYSVSTTEVERQNAIDVWQKKRLIGIRRDGTHNPTQELRRSVAMMGVTAGRRQLEHSGVRPLRRLRGTGSGLPTGVSVIGSMFSPSYCKFWVHLTLAPRAARTVLLLVFQSSTERICLSLGKAAENNGGLTRCKS